MDMTPNRVLCILVMILSLVYKSTSIRCYYCNSANNTACLDVNAYNEEVRAGIVSVVDCNTAIPNAISYNFFCRKIMQTIFHPHRESEIRVTRGCGWIRSEKGNCYKDDNSDHLGTVCQCFEDFCNSGDTVDPSGMTVLFFAFAICLCFWR